MTYEVEHSSYNYLPFVFFFGEVSRYLSYFLFIYFFFFYRWVLTVVCIFWTPVSFFIRYVFCKNVSPVCGLSSHSPCCYWTRISFSKTEQYSRECTYHILFIHSFANRFFDYFHLLWLCIILLWTFGIQALTFNFFWYIHRSGIVEYLFALKKSCIVKSSNYSQLLLLSTK